MGKTLYVTDLDGTLMHNDKSLSTFTIDTLNQSIDRGMLITYATARTFQSAWEITKDIHFNLPVITRNFFKKIFMAMSIGWRYVPRTPQKPKQCLS